MRTAHKLLLAAVAALAALAFASPASAQIEVMDEDNAGAHCGHVSLTDHEPTGGCEIDALSEANTFAQLATHVPGSGETIISRCGNDFEANIEETGHGFITHQVLSEPGAGIPCSLEPCDEVVNEVEVDKPWPMYMHEFVNDLSLVTTFCVWVNELVERACTIDLRINEASEHGAYEIFTRTPVASTSRCSQTPALSLTGHWVQNGGANIEIEHEEDV